jgi:hypothetical protein
MGGMSLAMRKPVISGLGATRTLNPDETGSVVLLDRAAGSTITLPTAPVPGTFFEFMVSVTCTSNAYKIITGAGTELLVGSILNCDTDTTDTVAIWKSLVGTSNISVNLNGSTKGGIKGDRLTFTCLNATSWQVTGVINSTGIVVTPFATS